MVGISGPDNPAPKTSRSDLWRHIRKHLQDVAPAGLLPAASVSASAALARFREALSPRQRRWC